MPTPLRFRRAVRALILSPDDEVLLARFVFPNGVDVWALPGGGLEDDETDEEGLRRELHEEPRRRVGGRRDRRGGAPS